MRARRIALLVTVTVALGAGVVLAARGNDGDSAEPPQSSKVNPTRSNGSAVVWAVGDGADGSDDAHEVADMIEGGKPDRLIYLGDVYDEGTREQFEEQLSVRVSAGSTRSRRPRPATTTGTTATRATTPTGRQPAWTRAGTSTRSGPEAGSS